jgi:hypothetical protein
LYLRLALNSPTLRALARIRIGLLAISDVRIMETNGQLWCGLPQVPVRPKANGGAGAGWRNCIEFLDQRLWVEIRETIIRAYREHAIAAGGAS